MARKATAKAKSKGKAKAKAKAAARPRRSAARKGAPARRARPESSPRLSREVVQEILMASVQMDDEQQLSDQAIREIALCAGVDPDRLAQAHRLLRAAENETGVTVLRVVELWDPEAEA